MASTSTSPKKRTPYTTKACNSCRRRRCKCDGVHPVCGTCSFYGHECTWSQEEDARRPATKQLVESLRMRIRELETENAELKIEPNAIGGTAAQESGGTFLASPDDIHSTHTSGMGTAEDHPGRSHLTMQNGSIIASGPTSMWSTFPAGNADLRKTFTFPSEATYQYIFLKDPSIPLHMQPHDVQLSEQCQWNRYLPVIDAEAGFTRLEHDILLHKLFSFHTVWLHALEPRYFLRDMLAQLTTGYECSGMTGSEHAIGFSPFLHCSLMSLATALSDNPQIREKKTRNQFALCAKQYLEGECERPTLAVVRALTFLSEYHASLGERGLGYLYFGMSCRMTRALGLCIDAQEWADTGRITKEEQISRDWLFWAVFCQDKVMSLDYGRDYDIPLPHLNVNLPAVDSELDQQPWNIYSAQGHEPEPPQPKKTTSVFFESCRLMLIAIRIMDAVYSQGRQNWRIAEKDSVSQIHLLLDSWYNNLPEPLVISTRSSACPLPHVITLNIAYWWLLMLLHRPFYVRTPNPVSSSPNEPPRVGFTDLSVKLCDRAAYKIIQLVTQFDKWYGLRYFPLNMLQAIFMAGATLLVQTATLPDSAVKKLGEAHEATRKCIFSLQAAAQTWDCAGICAVQLQRLLQEQTSESPTAASSSSAQHTQSIEAPLIDKLTQISSEDEGTYESNTSDPNQLLSQMFREYVSQQGENVQLSYELPLPAPQLQYQELHQLHQQPLLGMPSGSQFPMNPHILPLPYDHAFNEGYHLAEEGGVDYHLQRPRDDGKGD